MTKMSHAMNDARKQDGADNGVDSTGGSAVCVFCAGTGWRKCGHNHAQVCEHCCKHDKGWWELTEHHAGYVAGKDNACCRAGCGTMRRDLANNIDN